jgi:tripartite-type tricarboxylate transporter receptor subunit TctC
LQQRIHNDIRAVLDQPDTQEAIGKAGVDTRTMGRAEFAAYLQKELERWGPVIRSRNIRPD